MDLFSEGVGEGNEMGVALEGEEFSSQAEAHRRKDRLEREEFMTKCRVSYTSSYLILYEFCELFR